MKILFFGTPQLAVPYLEWLRTHHTVVGAVCRPDEPVGRGYRLTPPPVKQYALANGIPVFQPEGKWTDESIRPLVDLKADFGISVAYGRLMPKPVFSAPRLGTVNVHFSLLPKYRGAGPMQWTLINGDNEAGVTIFWVEEGLDSGPIFRRKSIPVDPVDDALTLKDKLIQLGLELLESVMKDVEAGTLIKDPQKGEPTMAPPLKKEHGKIDWSRPARDIANLIRGVREWPVAFTFYNAKKKLQVIRAETAPPNGNEAKPGTVIRVQNGDGVAVQAGKGVLLLKTVRPEGKKEMPAESFWNGARLKIGDRFE